MKNYGAMFDRWMTWRHRWLLLLAAGALSSLAQPPLSLVPLLAAGLVLLAHGVWRAPTLTRRFGLVFAFAWGYFAFGLYWVGIAFFVDAARFAWLLPLPVLGLPTLLAMFPAAGATLGLWALRRLAQTPLGFILALALGMMLGEWARGHWFTGFPWNLFGQVWTDVLPVAQSLSLMGVYGLTLVTLVAFLLLALALPPFRAQSPRGLAFAGVALLAALGLWGQARLMTAERQDIPGVTIRLVQANIPQAEKWRADLRDGHFETQAALSLARSANGAPPTHVVWPETAVTYFLDEDNLRLRSLLATLAPPDGLFIFGAPRRSAPVMTPDFEIWNSLYALAPDGRIVALYDKIHLVPFGEYLPLRRYAQLLGLDTIAAGQVDFSPGTDGRAVVNLPGLPPARALICYEGIFPGGVYDAARHGATRPAWLLSITNDAWFGQSIGPHQHFATMKARAIEQGLPAVRAASTGISAIIDPWGRLVVHLGLGQMGFVDGPLPQALAPTLYARWGDGLFWGIMALLFACILGVDRRRNG